MHEIIKLDHRILLSLQKWRTPFWNKLFVIFTFTGTGRFWILFSGTWVVLNFFGVRFTEHQNQFMKILIGPFIAFLIGRLIKNTVKRKRPSKEIPNFQELIAPPTCGSFPSNHTSSTFAFFIGLILIGHPLAALAGVWAMLIAYSRLYLGVHFLSDVIGGMFVGALAQFLVSLT